MDFAAVALQIIAVSLPILLGWSLNKLDILSEQFDAGLSRLVMNVALPSSIIASIHGAADLPDATTLAMLLAAGALTSVVSIAVSCAAAALIDGGSDERRSNRFAIAFGNCGFIGLPVLSAILGPEALLFAAIVLIPAILLSLWAQFKVKGAFAKYSEVRAMSGLSAEEVSRRLLDRNGLSGVRVERVPGELSDHYDPRDKVLRLSDSVNASRSIAAIGVAAHEVGHAVQDKENYGFLKFRNAIAPAVQLCSTASIPLFLIGLVIGSLNLLNLGILLFCSVLVFHLVTLPLEFDASARALRMLRETNILSQQEIGGAKAVLDAAALTYVAALVMTVLQLVRLIALRGMSRDE